MMRLGRDDYYVGRRRRRGAVWPAFLSAAALVAAVVLFFWLRPTISGTVTDAHSGQPVGGVGIQLGDQRATTDGRGRFTLTAVREPATLVLKPGDGYAPTEQEVRPGARKDLAIKLRPAALSGTIVHQQSGAPLPGVVVKAVNADGASSPPATTDERGRYRLAGVPDGARLVVEGPGFARKELEIGQRTALDLQVRPDIVGGVVRTKGGQPVADATVAVNGAVVTTGEDGAYTLAGVPDGAAIVVQAPGYRRQQQEPGDATTLDFALEPLVVKAIYLTPESVMKDEKFNALLALADRSEINAMVIDFKDETGWVWHDSKHAKAREYGAVRAEYDLEGRLKTLREHNVYTIARIVCMLDPTLAHKNPAVAIRNSKTGGIWENDSGVAWVNAMQPDVWRYNIAFAVEAAQLGFDEVQYDYVRFPSDGDIEAIDLGAPNTVANRTEAIYNFLRTSREALAPYGVPLAIDIFGIALFDQDDNGIGQQLEKMAAVVDYICPMIYPSHFGRGWGGFDIPNHHPYEIILTSLQTGGERIAIPQRKFRPWLQDFSYGRGIEYGPKEVRAQMQATYDFGATGWLLWNANNTFTEGALQGP